MGTSTSNEINSDTSSHTDMMDISSRDRSDPGRIVVVASRYNEGVTRRLLQGALDALTEAGYGDDAVDVVWVPGAFELPVVVRRALDTHRYRAAVALGAIIRGETSHFDYICSEAARGLAQTAREMGIPVGFGVLMCDSMSQALARAGGAAGNKGAEAAAAAIDTAGAIEQIDRRVEA